MLLFISSTDWTEPETFADIFFLLYINKCEMNCFICVIKVLFYTIEYCFWKIKYIPSFSSQMIYCDSWWNI